MKIRVGFVSNSSSSSFVIMAHKVDNDDHLKEGIKKIHEMYKNEFYYDEDEETVVIEGCSFEKEFYDDYVEKYIELLKNGYIVNTKHLDTCDTEAVENTIGFIKKIFSIPDDMVYDAITNYDV